MIIETLCSSCHRFFTRIRPERRGGRAASYCSHRCRQAAYRDRVTIARWRQDDQQQSNA